MRQAPRQSRAAASSRPQRQIDVQAGNVLSWPVEEDSSLAAGRREDAGLWTTSSQQRELTMGIRRWDF